MGAARGHGASSRREARRAVLGLQADYSVGGTKDGWSRHRRPVDLLELSDSSWDPEVVMRPVTPVRRFRPSLGQILGRGMTQSSSDSEPVSGMGLLETCFWW